MGLGACAGAPLSKRPWLSSQNRERSRPNTLALIQSSKMRTRLRKDTCKHGKRSHGGDGGVIQCGRMRTRLQEDMRAHTRRVVSASEWHIVC